MTCEGHVLYFLKGYVIIFTSALLYNLQFTCEDQFAMYIYSFVTKSLSRITKEPLNAALSPNICFIVQQGFGSWLNWDLKDIFFSFQKTH